MRKQNTLLTLILFLNVSCAGLDTNQVKHSELKVKGGNAADITWKDALIFKRTSWYYQANLLYEINIASIAPNSAFLNWLDKGERESVRNCHQILWVVDYAYDSRRVQPNYVKDVLSSRGFVDISAPNFEKNFINHPDTPYVSNKNYKMKLFCNQSQPIAEIPATIPGFKEEKIVL